MFQGDVGTAERYEDGAYGSRQEPWALRATNAAHLEA